MLASKSYEFVMSSAGKYSKVSEDKAKFLVTNLPKHNINQLISIFFTGTKLMIKYTAKDKQYS